MTFLTPDGVSNNLNEKVDRELSAAAGAEQQLDDLRASAFSHVEDEATESLIGDVEQLTLDGDEADADEASHAIQQEHMEMPSFE